MAHGIALINLGCRVNRVELDLMADSLLRMGCRIVEEDEAQAIVAAMRFKTGDDRNVWFKVVDADGKTQYVGVATVSGIKIGGGDASEYETFECTISWNVAPKQSAVVG